MAGRGREVQRNTLIAFLALRVLKAVPVILGVVLFSFVALHLAPGDPIDVLAGEAGTGDIVYMNHLRQEYGLDQPIQVQLLRYVAQLAHLNLGYSISNNMPVLDLILQRLGPTLLLMGTSIVLSLGLGVFCGALGAMKRGKLVDELISLLALLAYATPIFWSGLMLVILFSVKLHLLPTGGFSDAAQVGLSARARALDVFRHLILPAATLSFFYFAIYARLMRASTLDTLTMDYVRTARAKGIGWRKVMTRHVLRNALLPIVTMLGVQMASLLGGAVVVETVFNWPGLGRLTYDSVFQRDYQTLIGILMMSSALVIVSNILIDLVYARLDPRIVAR